MDFVDQTYWDNSYIAVKTNNKGYRDEITQLMEKYLFPNIKSGSMIEIGCYPGNYLHIFGEKGFEINGMDTTPQIKNGFVEMLLKNGYAVGEFSCENALTYETKKKYDVVCSFGFIEHFLDWQGVLKKHTELMTDNGYLVITTPNFSGLVQRMLHKYLDSENLSRHNIKSMDNKLWEKVIQAQFPNYECLFSGPFGRFDFWVDQQKRNVFQIYLIRIVSFINKKLKPYKIPNAKAYSPYFGLILKLK